MALLERLGGLGHPETTIKLSIGAFGACLTELALGQVTKAEIITYFGLDATEQTELDWVIARYNAQPDAAAKAKFIDIVINVVFVLAEARFPGYTTNAELQARINAI